MAGAAVLALRRVVLARTWVARIPPPSAPATAPAFSAGRARGPSAYIYTAGDYGLITAGDAAIRSHPTYRRRALRERMRAPIPRAGMPGVAGVLGLPAKPFFFGRGHFFFRA